MSQRRRHSFVEALVSAVIGIYTAISVARGYFVRRAFNRIQRKRASMPACFICQKPAIVQTPAGAWVCPYHAGARR